MLVLVGQTQQQCPKLCLKSLCYAFQPPKGENKFLSTWKINSLSVVAKENDITKSPQKEVSQVYAAKNVGGKFTLEIGQVVDKKHCYSSGCCDAYDTGLLFTMYNLLFLVSF